jgi:hypothetical protein
MPLDRRIVNADLEDDILTALITNTEFISKVYKQYDSRYFSDYGKTIAKWVISYWEQYKQAPGRNIQSIYNVEHEKLSPDVAHNISTYLSNLNDVFEHAEDVNLDYLLDKSREYFRRKAYETLFSEGMDLVSSGRMDEAEKLHSEFRGVVQATSKWENPFSPKVVGNHFADIESGRHEVLSFRGALGELIGPLEREWLVAFLGPMKRGKSFWLQEAIFQAIVARRRVAYINLEMGTKGIREREYRRISGLPDDNNRIIKLPKFDCYNNQTGKCPLPHMRTNRISLRLKDNDYGLPDWQDANPRYQVCTVCRGNPELRDSFIPDVWYVPWKARESLRLQTVARSIRGFARNYGDRLRQITYPAYSVTIADICRDLDELAYAEGFFPDLVILDYGDILRTEYQTGSERDRISSDWKKMKGIAGERRCLWITASQTNRIGLDKDTVSQKDIAEDIRKLAHVDVMVGINQTEAEKSELITRLNVLANRHRLFSSAQVIVLHQLAIGATYLDSEWMSIRDAA